MKFTLIMATLGRKKEIELFLKAINLNGHACDLIIIDQNNDDRVLDAIHSANNLSLNVIYKKVDFTGLSKARNYGLHYVSDDTDILAFPDDDCIYPDDLLCNLANIFNEEKSISIISGTSVGDINFLGSNSFVIKKDKKLSSLFNVFGNAISYTIFIRFCFLKNDMQYFDEQLGVGSLYGSTEETDYVYRLLSKDALAVHKANICIYHPDKDSEGVDFKRLSYYNLGVGAFIRKHAGFRCDFIYFFLRSFLLIPIYFLGRALISRKLVYFKVAFHLFLSRVIGFLNYKKSEV